ncbi:MAG: ribosome biogenesis GTP-binding protein YihA/YsxC, partial [Pseudomonadota bacterium]
GLARASNTPGRTQALNYFDLGGRLFLVDLPGYGFAEAPLPVVQAWQALLKGYLAGRPSLRRAYLLIDSRHGAKPVDHEIMTLLDSAAVSFQVVLTKTDKLKPGGIARVADQVAADLVRHPAAYPEMIATSSEKGVGIAELRAAIWGLSTI